ncbi:MAG TPA: hypothetical protein VM581_04520 [Magnetospirillaceae bacterium]|nr:hypothetical protein [Magnetospirillaceae bacterium]
MNQQDLHTYTSSLGRRPTITLPRHKQALKRRLLARHAHQQAGWFRFARALSNPLTGVVTAMQNKRSLLSGVGLSALVLGALTFATLTNQPVSAHDLVAKATDKMSAMDQGAIEAKNKLYQQNLNDRLREAKAAPNLRIIEIDELNSWGVRAERNDPEIAKYLTYTDMQQHRIVIGLNANNEPMLVMDVELFSQAKDVEMETNVPSSGTSPQPGKSIADPGQR